LSQSSRVLHFGLASASKVDSLEVHWLGGQTNFFGNLDANTTWELTEGSASPVRVAPPIRQPGVRPVGSNAANETRSSQSEIRSPGANSGNHATSTNSLAADKAKLAEFWKLQRAAMNALKIEKDIPKAIELFRAALALDADHEDAHY